MRFQLVCEYINDQLNKAWTYGKNCGDGHYCRFGKCHKADKRDALPEAEAEAAEDVRAVPFAG